MALVDLDEFKQVLEVGNIYADELLQEAIDTATNIVLSFLTKNQWGVTAHGRTNLVNKIWTDRPHDCYVGQSVVIANCGTGFNGTKTLTEVSPYTMSFVGTGDDYPKHGVVPWGTVSAAQYVDYETVPEVREAAMALACDVWISRSGTLGQQGVDFQPAPYRLGRSMMTRVSGLLAKHLDPRGMVG